MKRHYQWAVVGAGPAGIAAVGKLIDNGVSANEILWVDPHFNVGDLGQFWSNVSSNTKVKYFNDFLMNVRAFEYASIASRFALSHLDEQVTCTLSHIVEPLQWISNHLLQQVHGIKSKVHHMQLKHRAWSLTIEQETYQANYVILATGAVPSTLKYPHSNLIPFTTAIDKNKLRGVIDPEKTYAVFGSSHSAIIVVRHLVDLQVKKVINFYRSPCRYAVELGEFILFDNTGLKGDTAAWARTHIDGILPKNLVRYHASLPNLTQMLSECEGVIYAVGFEKNNTIVIEDYETASHQPQVGIIGPGLFGLGIAYPELKTDPIGISESQVGLWKFMVYLNKILPIWFKYTS